MLGNSSNKLDACILQAVRLVKPQTILELGCGQGKFGTMLQQLGSTASLTGLQKLFSPQDAPLLNQRGYQRILDNDILEYYRSGFDEQYDMIVALDVMEHFLISDAMSILHFSLYRANYVLLVWPSAHPQTAINHTFDRHRASFELRDISQHDIVFYTQTGFAQMHYVYRYHIALIRGFMNTAVLPPFLT